jgi:flagellar motor switch protein FliN
MERFELRELTGAAVPTREASLDLPSDMELDVRIDLGRTYLEREDVLRLAAGMVVPLDKAADEPVDVFVGGRLIARGEVVVLEGKISIRVAELAGGGTPI